MNNKGGQKPKSRGKNIAIIILSLLLVLFWMAYLGEKEDRERFETRVNGCQELIVGINTLLGQERNDYKHFSTVMSDWLLYRISFEKAQEEIDILLNNRDRRDYQYNLVRDKYEHVCFDVVEK